MAETHTLPKIRGIVDVWQSYAASIEDWQALVKGMEPKATGCGPVYELGNPLGRASESVAIADMRGVEFAQPHYHDNGEVEIYFVLQGAGRVVVGNKTFSVQKGSVVITPSGIAHYALPDTKQGLVLTVVNTPSFNPANNVDLTKNDPSHRYDHNLFKQLTQTV